MRSNCRRLIAVAGVAALVLTGCSLSGSGAGSGRGTITVGTLCLESGDTVVPESCTVVDAMAKAADAAGGVNGFQIKAVGCDANRADPTALPNCIRKLVYSDKVDVFVGNFQSAGLYKATEPMKIASLASSYGSPEDFTSPMAFPVWGDSRTGLPLSAQALADKGLRKPGAIVVNSASGQSSVQALQAYFGKQGISVDVIPASPSEADYSPFVSQAKAKGVNPLVVLQSAAQIATIARAAQGLGYRPTILAPWPAYDANLIKQAGPLLDGMVLGTGYKPWTAIKEGDELLKTMSKYGPANFNMNLAAVQSYVGMKILYQVLAKLRMNNPGPADVSSALGTGSYTDGFLPGPVSWADLKNNPPGLARVASLKVVVEQLQSGKLNILATRTFS